MDTTLVHGLVFDLDNTLLDREATFLRVAENFYEEHLCATMSVTRDGAVAMMVRWDCDGYSNREAMFAQWLCEWPEAGLDMGSLKKWYRSEMERQVKPIWKSTDSLPTSTSDMYRGASSQTARRASTANAGRQAWTNSPLSSLFRRRPAMPNQTRGYFAMP